MAGAISLAVAGSCAPVLAAGHQERWEGEEGVSVPCSGHGCAMGLPPLPPLQGNLALSFTGR